MSRRPNPVHEAWRQQFARDYVRAAYLRAQGRVITKKLAEGRKQLSLPLEDQAA